MSHVDNSTASEMTNYNVKPFAMPSYDNIIIQSYIWAGWHQD
jgi:hypothetical protein